MFKIIKLLIGAVAIVALVIIIAPSVMKAGDMKAPMAKVIPKIDSIHGYERVDDYFWLREKENPEVIDYLNAENAFTNVTMQHTEALQEEIFLEFKARIKETDLTVPVKKGDYYYYSRDEEGKQYKIYCRKKKSLESEEEILLDMNALAEGKNFMDLGTYDVSPDHSMLAYATDEVGNERYTLRIKNLKTGEILKDNIENISGDFAWANDNKTMFYTVPDDTWRPYQLYRHKLGDDKAKDIMIYQEDDEKFWMGISNTKSEKYILMEIGSKMTDEVHYLSADNPFGEFQVLRPRELGIEYSVYHHEENFYITTNDGAVNFKLMSAPTSDPSKENWVNVMEPRPEVKIDGLDIFENHMVIYEREGGIQKIRVTDMGNNRSHYIEFDEPVYSYATHSNPDFKSNIFRFSYESMLTPVSVYDYNMNTKERELKKQTEILGGFDSNNYESKRLFATATDGAKVPISLVYRKGTKFDGSTPLYLYGYGSYGASMDPYFSRLRISLLDRGIIFAIAHIRGGGEMGRPWYENGKLLNKKNTFTDFINCAEHLIANKYTDSDKLIISGGSAGGMLIGTVVNMRPELFKVAMASVPFVDVMNTMLDASIPLTVVEYEEWGNPNVKAYYDYIMTYSPYDNIKPQEYPNMLIMSSLNDTRVQYWEGTKWAAKLRVNNLSDNRLLLKTNMGAGHGGSSGRYDAWKEYAFQYAFLLDCLGMSN